MAYKLNISKDSQHSILPTFVIFQAPQPIMALASLTSTFNLGRLGAIENPFVCVLYGAQYYTLPKT